MYEARFLCYVMYCVHFVVLFVYANKSNLSGKMDVDVALNTDDKEQLLEEETNDSCRFDYIEIVSVARDTDGPCITECVSGDWFGEEVDLKQEPHDVCCIL